MSSLLSESPKIFRGSPIYYEQIEGVTFGTNPLDFLSLNLPPLCNYHCSFCFASETSDNQARLNEIRRNSLSKDEYTRIIQEAKSLGARHLEISGEGEPDLPIFRDTLRHIIDQATEQGIHTAVFANGSWLDENLLNFLRDRDTSLVVSIKYMNPEKYDTVVGIKGSFRKVTENINLARQIFGSHLETDGYSIYRLALFGAVLEDNGEDNAHLRRFCDENDIFFSLSTRIPHGRSEGVLVDFAQQETVVNEYSHGSMILADSSRGELGFSVCGTFYYGLGINYDGEIVFDAHADDTKGMIGNVREIGLTEAIRRQREIRDSFYREGGTSYCPLRDLSYPDFISRYGKER